MPQEKAENRVVKLHPHLEGKRLFFIDSSSFIIENASWKNRCRLEKIQLDFDTGLPEIVSIYDFMEQNDIDALVIHPEIREPWLQEIEEVQKKGKVVIVTQGDRVEKEAPEAYQHFRDLGIPIIQRGTVEFYETLLNNLEKQFAPASTDEASPETGRVTKLS